MKHDFLNEAQYYQILNKYSHKKKNFKNKNN